MSSTTTATGAPDSNGSTAGTETIAPSTPLDPVAVAASLPLDEKVALLTGAATWTLRAIPGIGLRTMTVSDGPIGVRGTGDDGLPSAQLPAPSATAATWDVELQARLGTLMAGEARRKAVDVILAPVVNLQRSPVGGRHFECLSEDPFLTARLAVAFVAAIQEQGIAACVKHFVGNETETDRTEYLSRIDERTLREVYLAPFEAVVDAGVWTIMAAYNGLTRDGVAETATAHGPLLNGILKGEWGFDGIVVSDWLATKTAVEPALGGLDLVMPGPGGPWADGLLAAVRDGRVPEAVIDDKVARIVRLAERVGALSGLAGETLPFDVSGATDDPAGDEVVDLLTEAAARSTVVLRNEGALLPIDPALRGRDRPHRPQRGRALHPGRRQRVRHPAARQRTARRAARRIPRRRGLTAPRRRHHRRRAASPPASSSPRPTASPASASTSSTTRAPPSSRCSSRMPRASGSPCTTTPWHPCG